MSEFVEIIGRDGKRRRARRGEILADGERLSLPLRFMDAVMRDGLTEKFGGPARVVDTLGAPAGNRPGFVGFDRDSAFVDAAAEAYEERTRRLTTAWQRRGEQQDADCREERQDPVRDARSFSSDEARAAAESAYAGKRYCDQIALRRRQR